MASRRTNTRRDSRLNLILQLALFGFLAYTTTLAAFHDFVWRPGLRGLLAPLGDLLLPAFFVYLMYLAIRHWRRPPFRIRPRMHDIEPGSGSEDR